MQESQGRWIGVELEYNSLDKLSRSVSVNGLPHGIYFFADVCVDALNKFVEINKWHSTNNNENWVIKPDASCGLELCSPPQNLKSLLKDMNLLINKINNYKFLESDNRCSFHIHIDIIDFDYYDLIYLIEKWVQLEPFFFFLCKEDRWINNYCKPLSLNFEALPLDSKYTNLIVESLYDNKYLAINLCNLKKKKKNTVEFRIVGSDACLDYETAASFCKIFNIFVERVKSEKNKMNRISNFEFLSIKESLEFLSLEDDISLDWIKSKLLFNFERFLNKKISFSNIIWYKIMQVYEKEISSFLGIKK